MNPHPVKLEREGDDRLIIEWSDGQRRQYACRELRDNCPCATCSDRHGAGESGSQDLLPVISATEAQPLRIEGMKPVGSYAYAINFSDGHKTGIYTFVSLRELGRRLD